MCGHLTADTVPPAMLKATWPPKGARELWQLVRLCNGPSRTSTGAEQQSHVVLRSSTSTYYHGLPLRCKSNNASVTCDTEPIPEVRSTSRLHL